MADTTGYYLFGGSVEDYVRQTGSDTLLPNTTIQVLDPSSGATITDLLDVNTNPVTSIVSDNNGEFNFWARLPVVLLNAGFNTYRTVSDSALEAAAAVPAQVATLQESVNAVLAGPDIYPDPSTGTFDSRPSLATPVRWWANVDPNTIGATPQVKDIWGKTPL